VERRQTQGIIHVSVETKACVFNSAECHTKQTSSRIQSRHGRRNTRNPPTSELPRIACRTKNHEASTANLHAATHKQKMKHSLKQRPQTAATANATTTSTKVKSRPRPRRCNQPRLPSAVPPPLANGERRPCDKKKTSRPALEGSPRRLRRRTWRRPKHVSRPEEMGRRNVGAGGSRRQGHENEWAAT